MRLAGKMARNGHKHSSMVAYLAQVIYEKKLSHHFLLHYCINIGSYDHHAKYQGVFMGLLRNTFFIRVPPLKQEDLNEFKGGTLMKKVFQKSPINTP